MRWRAKFSHISPVWYQIRWNGSDFTLSGQHDVDAGWMARLKLPTEPVRALATAGIEQMVTAAELSFSYACSDFRIDNGVTAKLMKRINVVVTAG